MGIRLEGDRVHMLIVAHGETSVSFRVITPEHFYRLFHGKGRQKDGATLMPGLFVVVECPKIPLV